MKTIYVKYYSPEEVMGMPFKAAYEEEGAESIKEFCFRVVKYSTPLEALNAYAETPATWSTLLEEDADVKSFIDEAFMHILNGDIDWLEVNFT